jgi:hypothetical protein
MTASIWPNAYVSPECPNNKLIPSLVGQDRYAQSRDPIEMIVQG